MEDKKVLPGAGLPCECAEHKRDCRFGRDHLWMFGYVPLAAHQNFGVPLDLAQRGQMLCCTCGAIHVED
jgi:hypothetical protein